jgi:hypothetical protein
VFASQFATTFDIKVTPLPCLQHLTEDQHQAVLPGIVGEIQARAEAENKEKGRQPMGVAAILAQDPHSKPASTDRSPAPFVHASDESTEMEFRVRYRAFVDAFRGALSRTGLVCLPQIAVFWFHANNEKEEHRHHRYMLRRPTGQVSCCRTSLI